MEIFLAYLLGIVSGFLLLNMYFRYKVNQFSKIIEHSMQETKNDNVVDVKLEKINDIIYVYDNKDNSYLAQGSSKEEIVKNLNKRFPNISFNAKHNNMKDVGLL